MKCSTLNNVDVLISASNDVFENLAFEVCLHKSFPVSKRALFLYRNSPSIVFGKFQNPWVELNRPRNAKQSGVHVARRCSGGGTVYHDLGNLNISFLLPRNSFNKRHNLDFIVSFLLNYMNCGVELNQRDDLVLNGLKISGSACRIERERTIHHLTLLMQSNLKLIGKFLGHKNRGYDVVTKATESVRSSVGNLFDNNSKWTSKDYDDFCFVLGQAFCEHHGLLSENIRVIDPNEFSGVRAEKGNLQEFKWLFGLTPKFSLNTRIENCSLNLRFDVEKGCIRDVHVISEGRELQNTDAIGSTLKSNLIGSKFLSSEICANLNLIRSNGDIFAHIATEIQKLALF